jgi:hypothetical protein
MWRSLTRTLQNKEFIDVIRRNGLSDRTVVTSAEWVGCANCKLAPDSRMLFISEKVPASRPADEGLWAVAVN